MIKKIFAVLTVCLLLAALAVPSFAVEETPVSDFEYSVLDNGIKIIKYIGSDTEVIIPAEIEGKPVREIAGGAFENCTSVASIEIPNGVVHIGFFAFRHCEALTSVKIPNSVVFIGDLAFADCISLSSIKLPGKLGSISDLTFSRCYSLTSAEIPENVTLIGDHAFLECSSLSELTIPKNVKSIGMCAFAKCELLETITIPYSVEYFGADVFSECDSLKTIIVPDSLDISKAEIPRTAAQIKYRKTANVVEITEIISGSDGNDAEIPKEICGIPVVALGEDISSHAGIYAESEEI